MNATNWTRLACLCGMLWSCMAVAQDVTCEADTLEVLVLLPFCVDADTMDNGAFPPKVVRLREIALEHLHGFELAAQQLAEAGMDIRLTVKDEMPDSAGRQRVTNLDIARTDMVFGPLMREQVGRVHVGRAGHPAAQPQRRQRRANDEAHCYHRRWRLRVS